VPLTPHTFHLRRATADLVTVQAMQRTYFDVVEPVEDKSKEKELKSFGQLMRGFASRERTRLRKSYEKDLSAKLFLVYWLPFDHNSYARC
jgi:hypothetical protein